MLTVPVFLAFFAAIAAVVIGFVVVKGDRANQYRKNFLILSLLVALWVVSNVLFVLFSEGELKLWVALASYTLALLLAVQLCVFAINFVVTGIKKSPLWVILPGVVVALLALIPGVVAYGVTEAGIQTHPVTLLVYAFFLLGYLVSANVLFIVAKIRASSAEEKQKLNVILLGVGVSAGLGAFCNLILPLFGQYSLTLLGPASAVFFIGAIAYVIVRHGLFDVRLAVVRSVAYSLVLGTTIGLYFGIAFLVSELLGSTITPSTNVAIALLLAFIFQPVKRFFDRFTNRVFYRDTYDPEVFFGRFSDELRATSDLRHLLKNAAEEIATTLKSEKAFFIVRYKNKKIRAIGSQKIKKPLPEELMILDSIGRVSEGIVSVEYLKKAKPRKLLQQWNIELVLIFDGEEGRNYLLLGPARGKGYTHRDIQTLKTISSELTIAIQNAIRFGQIQDFNEVLQQRIEEATKELRATNAQLQRLDIAKDEFVSMASHQLRTPLTSVKGYISMVLEGDVGKITATQRQLLGEAFTSSERMVHLINDFLNVSRLQTGKFMLERKAADLSKIVAEEVDSLQTTAQMHDLKLLFRAPSYFPVLYIDEAKIRQVIMNFIDNAIYYSPEETEITIELSLEDGHAILQVRDTGIGVPKSEQEHLFGKFFRATNARKQRPDGTGVGLFLAKKVVVAHGGTIVFHSEEGKGSTFGFRLPIKKLSRVPDDAEELEK